MTRRSRHPGRDAIRGTWRSRTSDDPYIDEIAVERACRGERLNLTHGEREAAITRLTAAGKWATEIALLLGCTPRTVTRYRTRHRETAGAAR